MRYAILVLEQPWFPISAGPRQRSVRPFLESLARLNDIPIYFTTYFDEQSFDAALKYLLDDRHLDAVDKVILHVAGQGYGARLGDDSGRALNLGLLLRRIKKYGKKPIAGLVLDSCELGMNENRLSNVMKKLRLSWLVAYGANMDWTRSMLINLSFMERLRKIKPKHLDDKEKLLFAIQGGLELFNPDHDVENSDEEEVYFAAFDDSPDEIDEEVCKQPVEEEWKWEEDEDDADEFDQNAERNLNEGMIVALRYRRKNGRFKTKILSDEQRWPALKDQAEEEA